MRTKEIIPKYRLFSSFDCYYTIFSERKKLLSLSIEDFLIRKRALGSFLFYSFDELLELESPPPIYWVKIFWKAWSLTLMLAACNSFPIIL